MGKIVLLTLLMALSNTGWTSISENSEICLAVASEQTQALREARQAFGDALDKENRMLFEAAITDLDYAQEVLDEALTDNHIQRQQAMLKKCRDSWQIKSALHLESMSGLHRTLRCHRLVNIANMDYVAWSKSKNPVLAKKYQQTVASAIKSGACPVNVNERLGQSSKRLR
jgi:hypothetical protein